jgi:REP element-mobilizing transposase RayT
VSTRYKFIDKQAVYFTTSTVVGWGDVFTREVYKTILLDTIRHCQLNQGLILHAWVLMTNHLHTICSFKEGKDPGQVLEKHQKFHCNENN